MTAMLIESEMTFQMQIRKKSTYRLIQLIHFFHAELKILKLYCPNSHSLQGSGYSKTCEDIKCHNFRENHLADLFHAFKQIQIYKYTLQQFQTYRNNEKIVDGAPIYPTALSPDGEQPT